MLFRSVSYLYTILYFIPLPNIVLHYFDMYISSVSAIALAIGAAMAQTAGLDPITAPPQGPITIPAGSPYKIEWEKTECALISLQLLAGADPSTLEIQSPPIASMLSS